MKRLADHILELNWEIDAIQDNINHLESVYEFARIENTDTILHYNIELRRYVDKNSTRYDYDVVWDHNKHQNVVHVIDDDQYENKTLIRISYEEWVEQNPEYEE